MSNNSEFFKNLNEELKEIENKYTCSRPKAFVIWVGKNIFSYDEEDIVNEYLFDGPNDNKLDLGIIDENEQVILIIQVKYSLDHEKKTFGKNEIKEVNDAYESLNDKSTSLKNEKWNEFKRRFNNFKKYEKIKIFVGFGKISSDAKEYAKKNNITIYDFDKIKQHYFLNRNPAAFQKPKGIKLKAIKMLEYNNILFVIASVNEIYKIYKNHGPGLLDENLRYKLAGNKRWNLEEKIKNTLTKEANIFLTLNNGITIISNKTKVQNNDIIIYDPQIVNGGQTINAIYDTLESFPVDAKLLIKIVNTDDKELRKKISFATNFQIPITPRDLQSNDDNQKIIQQIFIDKFKIFYERKRGEWELIKSKKSKANQFKTNDGTYRYLRNEFCGQLYLSLLGFPSFAKSKKQKIFDDSDVYTAIFNCNQSTTSEKIQKIGSSNIENPKYLGNNCDDFVDDIVFAYGIYKLTKVYSTIYDTIKKNTSSKNKKISELEHIKYWNFHVIYIFNKIIEYYANDKKGYMKLRYDLIGNYKSTNELDDLFRTNKKLSKYFNKCTDPNVINILDIMNLSKKYKIFSKWIESLNEIVFEYIQGLKQANKWKDSNTFWSKNPNSLSEIWKLVEDILQKGTKRELYFPKNP